MHSVYKRDLLDKIALMKCMEKILREFPKMIKHINTKQDEKYKNYKS